MWSIGKAQVYEDSIVPTAVKVFSDPLRIIAEYEKICFSTRIFYGLQCLAIIILLEIAMEGLHLGIIDIVAPADVYRYGFWRCRDLPGKLFSFFR